MRRSRAPRFTSPFKKEDLVKVTKGVPSLPKDGRDCIGVVVSVDEEKGTATVDFEVDELELDTGGLRIMTKVIKFGALEKVEPEPPSSSSTSSSPPAAAKRSHTSLPKDGRDGSPGTEMVYRTLIEQATQAHPTLSEREACARFMRRMTKAQCPPDEQQLGPLVVIDHAGGKWEYTAVLREFAAGSSLCQSYPFVADVGRKLKLSANAGAKRGSDAATEAASKKRAKRETKAKTVRGDKNEAKGLARTHCTLDGSRGGSGFHNHGGLKQVTKDSKVVQDAHKLLAPADATKQQREAGQLNAAQHYVAHVHSTGEIPASIDELRQMLPSTRPIKEALEWAAWLLAKTTEPDSKLICVDIEGKSSAKKPLSQVNEIGMGKQSLAMGGAAGPSGAMEPLCDERGGKPGHKAPLALVQVDRAARALTSSLALSKEQVVLHYAGSDHLVVAALCEQRGVPQPRNCNVHAAICVLLGRDTTGRRLGEAESSDGLASNMESLAYMLGLKHTHHGLQDVGSQFGTWRPLLTAMFMHYHGE